MKSLRRFSGLSWADRRLLVEALVLAALVRLGLWLLPFRIVRGQLDKIAQPSVELKQTDPAAMSRVAWAVSVMSRCLPAASCLTQALATRCLLARRGYLADLRIGVIKADSGQLEAHAWVESEGQVIIGGSDSPFRFTPLPSLEGEGQ